MIDEIRHRIIQKYFSNEEKTIHLKPGEVLLCQNELNTRLFYIEKGSLCGYLTDQNLAEPVFEAESGGFIGVFSFFSKDHNSYADVVAEKESLIRYFDEDPFLLPNDESQEFITFLFSVVVNELRQRQQFAGKMAHERQDTLQKLIQSEKMVTLGQMAAGLAHELNNTIASLSSNLGQMQQDIQAFLNGSESKFNQDFFQKGLINGQETSSAEARNLRNSYSGLKFIDKTTAKKLARTGITSEELKKVTKGKTDNAETLASIWELGYLLHDMQISATHAAHVIQSVKSVGVSNQRWSKEVDVNKTVSEALAILRSLTKNIEVEDQLADSLPLTEACSGELVQVWINLIKNAIESLLTSETVNPRITVKTQVIKNDIHVAIIDSGPGIPQELYDKVFRPNFTTKVGGLSFGLGLGLTIVKRIVNEHNGSIDLVSKPGHTEFDIYIPIIN